MFLLYLIDFVMILGFSFLKPNSPVISLFRLDIDIIDVFVELWHTINIVTPRALWLQTLRIIGEENLQR